MKQMIITTFMLITVSSVPAATSFGATENRIQILSSAAENEKSQAAKDERIPIDRTSPEFKQLNAIGVVTPTNMKSFGTGFLVDACHVITNQHGIYAQNEFFKKGEKINFSVGQTDLKRYPFKHTLVEGAVLEYGEFHGMESQENADWIIIRLSKPLGNDVGFISIYQMDIKKQRNQKLITAGYPGNRTNNGGDLSIIYADMNCKIIAIGYYGNNYHTCQATAGQSGSPLLAKGNDGKYYAIGMMDRRPDMTRSEDTNISNIGVSFDSGKSDGVKSEGDKIMEAIRSDSCE